MIIFSESGHYLRLNGRTSNKKVDLDEKMKISGLNIRLRIFVHEYLQSTKQNIDAWDNRESKKGKQIGKNVGDLKKKK